MLGALSEIAGFIVALMITRTTILSTGQSEKFTACPKRARGPSPDLGMSMAETKKKMKNYDWY
jgi:hypothetical protein